MGYLVERGWIRSPVRASQLLHTGSGARRVSSKTRFSFLEIRFEDAQMRDTFGQNRPREYNFMMIDVGMLRSWHHRGSIPFRGRGVPNPIPRFHGPRPTITDRLNAGSHIRRYIRLTFLLRHTHGVRTCVMLFAVIRACTPSI